MDKFKVKVDAFQDSSSIEAGSTPARVSRGSMGLESRVLAQDVRGRLDRMVQLPEAGARREELEARVIAQTLHGYDQGHRLLAQGGDFEDAELSLLDRLSDLSGYVPLGTDFERYYTGFPCGRYYAFACTWPDQAAPRAGTVLTHTLLFPREIVESVQDLWRLSIWHRRPQSAADREAYATPLLHGLEVAETPSPEPAAERALAAVALWFGQPDRPVLWVEDGQTDDVVRYLWGLLWPEARQRFAFCTFSLQARHLRHDPFGFLALPPAARGAFHERARSAAWWQDGRLSSAELRERAAQPWARSILEGRTEATWAMPRFCRAHALPLLEEAQFPVFRRFLEVEEAARSRLTAARACADLLDRLWPGLAPTHPLVRTTLLQLLQRQVEAPQTPHPFWELGDFLMRPAVGKLAEVDAEFASAAVTVIANELRGRLPKTALDAIPAFTALLADAVSPPLRAAIFDAVRAAFETMPEGDATDKRASALLLESLQAHEPLLVQAILAALPPARRAHGVLRALRAAPESAVPTLADYVLTAARQLADLLLMADVWSALNHPARGMMEDAASIVLAAPHVDPERLRPVLARLCDEDRLEWALEVEERPLAAWAGERGAEAARALQLPLQALFERCRSAPNGAHVLLSRLDALTASQLRDDDLLSPSIAEALASSAAASPVAKRVAERLAPRLLDCLARSQSPAAGEATWLRIPLIQETMAQANAWSLFPANSVLVRDPDCLPNLARALFEHVRGEPAGTLYWAPNALTRPLRETSSTSLSRSADALASVLSLPPDRDGWKPLAAQVLAAVRRTRCPTAHRLVELSFPVLYPALVRGELDAASRASLLDSSAVGWDLGRSYRHWLLDCWLDQRWPPGSFLRCLGDDVMLFRRIAHRAAKRWRGRELLRSLQGALDEDQVLSARWSGPLAQVLADPEAPIDYD